MFVFVCDRCCVWRKTKLDSGCYGEKKMQRGFAGIGLYMPKNDLNVGGAVRAANCYNASLVAVQGRRYWPMSTDTAKAYKHLPVLHNLVDLFEIIPYACQPVAVDLVDDAESLVDFHHPESAFYIFGPEDGTLGKNVLDRCARRVMIPMNFCSNLAATVNVVLYDRMAKMKKRDSIKSFAQSSV